MKTTSFKTILIYALAPLVLLFNACSPKEPKEINIGFIGPITGNATDFGLVPANAISLAIEQYNSKRLPNQPKVNFYYENDEWKEEYAIPKYEKLRKEHNIDVLYISNTEGTVALQQKVLADHVIMINALNNDDLLSTMNKNTFKIGKKTEEASRLVALRIIELGKKNATCFHVKNYFMTIYAKACEKELIKHGVKVHLVPVDINKEDYREELEEFKENNCDAIMFFGYKNLGFAMKQARDLKIDAPFFAANTIFGKGFYENSQGTMLGTEFPFFTENDGNYILAFDFSNLYQKKFGQNPTSLWPAMQAYDATNIVLEQLKKIDEKPEEEAMDTWLINKLNGVTFFQGVCGNIAISENGASKGIYFSLYKIINDGLIEKVKR